VFWTSGTDEGSEGTFGMGEGKSLLPKTAKFEFSQGTKMLSIILNLVRWAGNQPDDASKTQNCLAVEIFAAKYGFRDETCASTYRYICYVRDTDGLTTPGKHAQSECAFNFGINESNINFQLTTVLFTCKLRWEAGSTFQLKIVLTFYIINVFYASTRVQISAV